MFKRLIPTVLAVTLALGLLYLVPAFPAAPLQAQAGCRAYAETGKNLCGKFLAYWDSHGGLAQQGYPISNEFQETSTLDGKTYTVQYFERAVFELHPENAGTPYEVLLSQLGTYQFRARYPNGEPASGGGPGPTPSTQSISGAGTQETTHPLTLKAGPARVRTSSPGTVISATLLDANGAEVAVVMEGATGAEILRTINIPAAGRYTMQVEHVGAGTWTMVIEQ